MTKRYGLLIDLDRCTGCRTCTVACKMENRLEQVSGIRVETVGGPLRDTPAGKYPNLSMYYLPVPCMHCSEPPCLPSCPTEAIYRRQDGIVLIDEEEWNGCQQCLEACPYDMLAYDPEKDKVWKCTLCAHRVDQGLEPFCVDLDSPTSHCHSGQFRSALVHLAQQCPGGPAPGQLVAGLGLIEGEHVGI